MPLLKVTPAGAVEVKTDQGEATAIFSTFGVVDSDGDVTLPGAFAAGTEVPISAYGHTSWQGALPVGKATVHTDRTKAWVDAQFFMGTAAGHDTFEVVKQLGELCQWSYGFDVLDAEPGEVDGRRVRVLKRLRVHEVSPVLVGAGVGTRTVAAKDDDAAVREYLRFLRGEYLRTIGAELAAIRDRH